LNCFAVRAEKAPVLRQDDAQQVNRNGSCGPQAAEQRMEYFVRSGIAFSE
jgi:hypothetical protein